MAKTTKKSSPVALDPAAIAREIVANAESANTTATQQTNPTAPSLNLPAGQSTQTTFNVNSFDPRFPTGFVTIVTDKNDNPVGYVKDGKVVNLLEPGLSLAEIEAEKNAAAAPGKKLQETKNAQMGSFNYAQTLQQTAQAEYQQMLTNAQIVSRGEATPEQKQQLETDAKEYASTMVAIKTAYQKSGAVTGSINLDPASGKLATGTNYVDPTTAKPTTVTAQGETPTVNEPRYDVNGNSLVPGTAAYEKGSTTRPTATKTTGTFGAATPVTATTGNQNNAGANAGAGVGTGTNTPSATNQTGFNQLDQYGQPIFTKVNQTGPESLTPVSPMDATASGPLTVNDQLAKLAKQYGAFGAMALANPWMLQILSDSVNAKGGALPTQAFIDKIQANPNWAQMGQSMQKANEDFYGSGGAAWYTQYDATWKAMYNSAVTQGLDPSALGPELKPSDTAGIAAAFKDTNNPVTTLLNTYYDDPQTLNANLDHYVATHAKIAYNPASGTPQGQIAANVASLRNTLSDYGMSGTYTDTQLQDYAQKIQGGLAGYDLNSFTAQQQQNAINTYKPFAEQIKSGQTVSQIAAPYMSTLTGLLEVDPSDVVLGSSSGYGKIISDALRGDANGNVVDPLSFANTVRQQPQWLNTQNAQRDLLGNANAIISKMGLG